MTKMTQRLHLFAASLLVAGSMGLTQVAQADILLEPYLGYYTGTSKQTGTSDTKDKGVGYGGRIGYQQLGFMLGVDYQTGSWTTDSNPSSDLTPTNMGAFVGYNFPLMVRVYAEYILSAKVAAKQGGASHDFTGSGMKVGLGFRLIPLLSLNLEYISNSLDKFDGSSISNKVTHNIIGVTLSAPLTF